MTGKSLKYLLGWLNSKIFGAIFSDNFPELQGGTRELRKVFFEQIPIPQIPEAAQQPFIQRVDQILALKAQDPDADTVPLEAEIDRLVYQLYDLSDEEIKLIEDMPRA